MPLTKPMATVEGLPADFAERVSFMAIMANYA
jgi:hypothetical protein